MVLNNHKVKTFLLFFLNVVLMPGYAIHAWLGISMQVMFFVVSGVSLMIVFQERVFIKRKYIDLIALVLFFCFIAFALSFHKSQLLMGLGLGGTILVVVAGRDYILSDDFIRYSTIYMWLLIIGAVIGFVFWSMGGVPMSSISVYIVEGGRELFLYLTTYASYPYGGLLRPAGLFDEPGALAFFITTVICVNEMRHKTKYSSALALIFGLITGSLVLFILFVLYLLFDEQLRRGAKPWIIGALLVVLYYSYYDLIDAFFMQRLQYEDGGFAGDNRSHQVESFFQVVDFDIFLKGALASNKVDRYIDQSSNPFSILYGYGFVMWLIYFALEMYLIYAVVFFDKRVKYASLAMFLTLLQRPYLFNVYWTFLIVFVTYCIVSYKDKKSELALFNVKYSGESE